MVIALQRGALLTYFMHLIRYNQPVIQHSARKMQFTANDNVNDIRNATFTETHTKTIKMSS